MPLAADQRHGLGRRAAESGDGRDAAGRPAPPAGGGRRARRPRRGLAAEQVDAERVEVLGHAGHELARRRRVEPLLVHQHARAGRPRNGSRPVSAS